MAQMMQGCFLAQQCYRRNFIAPTLYDGILHLIIKNCQFIPHSLTASEQKELRYAIDMVEEFSDLCSWKRRWRYALFAYISLKTSPKNIAFLAKLLH